MAQSMEQQQALQEAKQNAKALQEEGEMRARRAEITLKGKEAQLQKLKQDSEFMDQTNPSTIFSPSPSPPPKVLHRNMSLAQSVHGFSIKEKRDFVIRVFLAGVEGSSSGTGRR
jgi:hypothetical protein